MSWRHSRAAIMAACALLIVGVSAVATGCTMSWAGGATPTIKDAIVNQAIRQLQAALGLPDGVIAKSSQAPILPTAQMALTWKGGEADLGTSGQICFILAEASATTVSAVPTQAELDQDATVALAQLGWDSASLAAHGFTAGEGRTVDHGDAGTTYETTWVGHDQAGIPNEGIIEVGVDTSTGQLRDFLFTPGPETAATTPTTITQDQAIAIAKNAAGNDLTKLVTTTTGISAQESTTTGPPGTTSTTVSPTAGSTSSTIPAGSTISVANATLIHTDAAGLTGGKDMLVWIVKLTEHTPSGNASASVYVDAAAGKVLTIEVTG